MTVLFLVPDHMTMKRYNHESNIRFDAHSSGIGSDCHVNFRNLPRDGNDLMRSDPQYLQWQCSGGPAAGSNLIQQIPGENSNHAANKQ